MPTEIIDALRGDDGRLHMPQVGRTHKGKGRGAERDTVKSWSLPLKDSPQAKAMPPIELSGGSYDADRVAHFPSTEAYEQYAARTETEDGKYERL